MGPQTSSFAVPNGGLAIWDGKDGVVRLHSLSLSLSLSLSPGFIFLSKIFREATHRVWLREMKSCLGFVSLLGRGKGYPSHWMRGRLP